jgi:cell division transport system permease protein
MADSLEKYTRRGIRTGYFSTLIGVTLVLFLVGILLSGLFLLQNIEKETKESLQGDVFFKSDQTVDNIQAIRKKIATWNSMKRVVFVSSDQALKQFSGAESEQILSVLEGENPIPPTLTFNPSLKFATRQGMESIRARMLREFPLAVAEVSYDPTSFEKINGGFRQFLFVFLGIAGLLVVIAFALINNTIRLSLYSKRFTIKTMQLVGATRGFIRRPFLWQAMVSGFLSALLSMGLLLGLYYAIAFYFDAFTFTFSTENVIFLSLSLLIIGVFITFVSTLIALNRFLRITLDKLY